MRFALSIAVVTLCSLTATAEDWTGKKVKTKGDVKPGRRDGAGLIRGTEVVKKDTELTVKSDDGTYLELDGKLGTIFKSEAVLSSDDPNALPSDGTTWKAGTVIYGREPDTFNYLELRSRDGLSSVKVNWTPRLAPTVVKDGDDGTLLVTDGTTEGWLTKKNLLIPEDVPVWAERRLKANPKDLYALWVRTQALIDQKEYDAAVKDMTAAIRIAATEPAYHSQRGWLRMKLGEFEGAITDLDEALRLDPRYPSTVMYRGLCRLRVYEYDGAEKDLTAWLEEHPDDIDSLPHRAFARFYLGQWEKAVKDAEKVLKADPKEVYSRTIKARSLAKLKKYKEAKAEFETDLSENGSDYQYARYAHFLATCPQNEYRDAVAAVSLMKLTARSFEDNKMPMPAEYLEVFAAAYAEGGEYELAVEKQTEVVKRLKANKRTPAAEVKRAEAALNLYKKDKPLRDE